MGVEKISGWDDGDTSLVLASRLRWLAYDLRVLSLSPCRAVEITFDGLTPPVVPPRSAKRVPASWVKKSF